MWGGALNKNVVAEAGKTATLNLGGTGRPVVGRLALAANMPERWLVQHTTLMTNIKPSKPPFPDNWAAMEAEQKKQWYEKWLGSDEGEAFRAESAKAQAARKYYSFPVGPDGNFRVEDVEAGE